MNIVRFDLISLTLPITLNVKLELITKVTDNHKNKGLKLKQKSENKKEITICIYIVLFRLG